MPGGYYYARGPVPGGLILSRAAENWYNWTMDTQFIIELVGYLGSAIVLISFLMTSVFKLRIVNTVGSLIFMTYALIIHSYPTAIMNFCLVLINIHFLWKMRHGGEKYELVPVDTHDDYLKYIIERQKSDILSFFPGIDLDPAKSDKAYIITCNGAPVGITMYREETPGEAYLTLDYTYPEYRDFSIGKFLVRQLKSLGIEKLIYQGPTENHLKYLNKLGFQLRGDRYEKDLKE